MSEVKGRVKLADTATGPGRSTATLLASLHSRMMALHLCSGADAIASLTAGFAQLGRAARSTSQGARLRQAIEQTRAAVNGRNVWSKMRLTEWACGIYPAPVLDQLRNDLALLLAEDVDQMLDALPIPGEMIGLEGMDKTPDVEFLDVVLGLWAFSQELIHSIEAIAAPMMSGEGSFTADSEASGPVAGPILR